MRLLAPTSMLTTNSKVDANGKEGEEVRVCSNTQAKLVDTNKGNATIAIQLEETKVVSAQRFPV